MQLTLEPDYAINSCALLAVGIADRLLEGARTETGIELFLSKLFSIHCRVTKFHTRAISPGGGGGGENPM